MTGDLILRYERMAADRGDHEKAELVDLSFGLEKVMGRIERSLYPDRAALKDAKEAIRTRGLARYARPILKAVIRALPRCESHIEKALLPWLVIEQYPHFEYRPRVLFPGQGGLLEDMCVAVVPQLQLGPYRVDFAVASRRGGNVKFVVVECDGADFHEGDDQKARDAARDADLLARRDVLEVVRFTGTAIYRAPGSCAAHVADRVFRCRLVSNKATAHKFGAVA